MERQEPGSFAVGKQLLVGTFDATKRILDRHSPQGWSEYMVNIVNKKILPKLSPDELRFVARHKKTVETGIDILGFGASFLEWYVLLTAAKKSHEFIGTLVERARFEKQVFGFVNTNERFAEMKTVYAKAHVGDVTGWLAFAGTMYAMLDRVALNSVYHGRNHLLAYKHSSQARRTLEGEFIEAFRMHDSNVARLHFRRPPDPVDQEQRARDMFADWQRMKFVGLRRVLSAANITDRESLRVYARLMGPDRVKHGKPHITYDSIDPHGSQDPQDATRVWREVTLEEASLTAIRDGQIQKGRKHRPDPPRKPVFAKEQKHQRWRRT